MNKKIFKSKYYIKKYIKWLFFDLNFFWLSLIGFTIPFILIYIYYPDEGALLRLGAFLQFVGIVIIFYDINKNRKIYIKDSFLDKIKLWYSKKPKKYGSTSEIEPDGIKSSIDFTVGSLTQVFEWNDEKSIEDNVKYLFKSSEINRQNIGALEEDLKCMFSKDNNNIRSTLNNTISSISDLERNVNKNIIGGLKITFVSSFWVLTGMLLSTLTKDIVNVINILAIIDNDILLNIGFILTTFIFAGFVFLRSTYAKTIIRKLHSGEINLKNEDMGKVLLQHIGEIGIAVLLLDELQTTSIKYALPLPIEMINYLWIIFKILVFFILLCINFYSYGRLAIVFGNKDISGWKFFLVLLLSVFVFGVILIT